MLWRKTQLIPNRSKKWNARFESYGYDADRKKYYGFSPKEFRTILNDLGLTTSSGHYGINSQWNRL